MPPRRIRTAITARGTECDMVHLVLLDPDHRPLPIPPDGAHIDLYLHNGITRTYWP
ncbi:hypothetical protein [Xanthobacter variabilis]|uniref:hypothetical protein n=1 Tax=Xanthobacter variabilis TaxID=3119932 RepID=UPI00372C5C7F